MNKSVILKNKIILFVSFLITFFIFIYLVYFLINGQRGLIQYLHLTKIADDNNQTLANLKRENNFYIDRTMRLQTNSVDLDFLDEQVRKNLGLIDKNEIVIILNK